MEKDGLEILTGSVEEIVFHSEESGFTVLEMDCDGQLITVVGEMAAVDAGEELKVTGRYANHPTYGVQFRASVVEHRVPATANAILKYLSSGAIRGIGPALARRMVETFGEHTLEIMEQNPEKLSQVRGISISKAREFGEEYQRIFGIRAVMAFLAQYQIEPSLAIRIWKLWGLQAPDQIRQHPYCLCGSEIGLSFEEADAIATDLGIAPDAPTRLAGGILHVLRHNLQNGHCCLPYEKLLAASRRLLEAQEEEIDETLTALADQEELIGQTVDGQLFFYLPDLYEAETYVAGRLRMMTQLQPPVQGETLEEELAQLERELGIVYAPLQREAIQAAVRDNLLILTGGPGTGKTTTLNGIIQLLEQKGHKVGLAAPTGRAAKRMSELTGREAKTIHRLLEVDYTEEGRLKFRRNAKNPLPFGAVVIDEMSMVDIDLFQNLLRAIRMNCKLILVGDPDQLPSVGPGNVLKDLIDSQRIPMVHLSQVFRQAAQSLIVTNAHAIVQGELPDLQVRDNDFFFLPQSHVGQAAQTVIGLCHTRLPKRYGFSPLWDIQVLCPSRMGPLGSTELNRQLQQVLNPPAPGKVEMKQAGFLFREGDKVMQIRNNYDIIWKREDGEEGTGAFNGDIGVIEMIDQPSRTILVRYDDRVAEYVFEQANELELAYAVTVHKSQGSEFEAVILPLMGYHKKLYYRNLLYTAVTRAKQLLIVAGEAATVQQMVQNDKKTLRYTNLKGFLMEP